MNGAMILEWCLSSCRGHKFFNGLSFGTRLPMESTETSGDARKVVNKWV